jgi:hypothetical protein
MTYQIAKVQKDDFSRLFSNIIKCYAIVEQTEKNTSN